MGSQTQPKIAVVDFTKEDLKPGSRSWLSAGKEVRRALEEYGCFAAVYDKVTAELSREVMGATEELFGLPVETKVRNVSDMYNFGYIGMDPNVPHFESMGFQNATALESVQSFTNLLWPSGNHHFCETMHSYAKRVSELDQMVKRMLFENYGVEKHYESHVESTDYLLRYMSYGVPKVEDESPRKGVDLPAHTDKTMITILHQNQVSGLEIQAKDGEWFVVEFPPSSFIVMAGDSLLAWSNDRVHAALHRVRLSGNKARYTIGMFTHIKGIVQIPEEMVDDEHPLRFKPFDNFGMLRFGASEEGKRVESVVKAYCGVSEEKSL